MCHVSVGHVQRAVEGAGIPTVGVYVRSFGHIPDLMGVARAIVTDHPMGRPLGAPGDGGRQLAVVRCALSLLEGGQAIVDFGQPYRSAPR